MSVYAISQFCHRLTIDPAHRARAAGDISAALAEFGLTRDEREAIEAGDVGALMGMGVHPLLVARLWIYAVAGLTEAEYSTRMRRWAAENGIGG